LQAAIEPLLVERQELELFRFPGEDAGLGEGGLDLVVILFRVSMLGGETALVERRRDPPLRLIQFVEIGIFAELLVAVPKLIDRETLVPVGTFEGIATST